jgi:hypothetical protein
MIRFGRFAPQPFSSTTTEELTFTYPQPLQRTQQGREKTLMALSLHALGVTVSSALLAGVPVSVSQLMLEFRV